MDSKPTFPEFVRAKTVHALYLAVTVIDVSPTHNPPNRRQPLSATAYSEYSWPHFLSGGHLLRPQPEDAPWRNEKGST
jgi:hypothetical protein